MREGTRAHGLLAVAAAAFLVRLSAPHPRLAFSQQARRSFGGMRRWAPKNSSPDACAPAADVAGGARWQRKELAESSEHAAHEFAPKPRGQHDGPLKLAAVVDFAVENHALVDIGANLCKCSPQDLAAQLARAAAARVEHVMLTGCSVKGSRDAKRLCEQWNGPEGWCQVMKHLGAAARQELEAAAISQGPKLTFTAGVHPHDAKSCDADTLATLKQLAQSPFCVSIGECGLDYDRMFSPREVQLEWFRKQVELAVELNRPLFLHERDRDAKKGPPIGSAQDLLQILSECKVHPEKVCIHCFTGQATTLREYTSRGYYIGLTGFAAMKKRGAHIRQLLEAGALPLERLMIETDCPFMLPDKDYLPESIGIEGRKNEPCCMPAVCRAVAECLAMPPADVACATTMNAVRFFGLS